MVPTLKNIYLFLFMLLMSVMMILTSNSWFMSWMFLEVNTLSFITLSFYLNKKIKQEMMMKYFIIQSSASIILLSSMIPNPYLNMKTWLIAALLLKMGAVPFHMWFVQIMEKLNWNTCFILSTIQKLPPLILMLQMTSTTSLKLISILNGLISSISGIIQTNLKLILAYSSIMHLSWMILVMSHNFSMMLLYFFIYLMNTMIIMDTFNKMNISKINQMSKIKSKSMKMLIILSLLNLSGMPPMLGFLGKILILKTMNFSIYTLTLLFLSTISMFFYLKISIYFLIESKMSSYKKAKINITSLTMLILLITLPLYSILL